MFLPESWLKLANRKSGQDFAKYGEMFIVTAHHTTKSGGMEGLKKERSLSTQETQSNSYSVFCVERILSLYNFSQTCLTCTVIG